MRRLIVFCCLLLVVPLPGACGPSRSIPEVNYGWIIIQVRDDISSPSFSQTGFDETLQRKVGVVCIPNGWDAQAVRDWLKATFPQYDWRETEIRIQVYQGRIT